MDLIHYFRILRRRWALIAVAVVIGAGFGVGSAQAQQSSTTSGNYYKASHVLFFDSSGNSGTTGTINLDQAAVLTTNGDVPNLVAKKLGGAGRDLAERVLTTTNGITNTLAITAIARAPGSAETLADTFADQLSTSLQNQQQARFTADRDQTAKRLDTLQASIQTLDAQLFAKPGDQVVQAQRDGTVNQYSLTYEHWQQLAAQAVPKSQFSSLEPAHAVSIDSSEYNNRLSQGQLGQNFTRVDTGSGATAAAVGGSGSSSFQGPVSRGFLGGFFGLLAGVGLALLAERLDRRLRTRHEVEETFGVPVLAEVPELSRAQKRADDVVSFTAPLSRGAEAHRAVRSALLFQKAATGAVASGNGSRNGGAPTDRNEGPLVVLVTSATSQEGKSTTTANLAAVFAEAGASVLAANCDFRHPTLHRLLGAANEPRTLLKTKIPGVMLVSGAEGAHANPAQIIAAQRQMIKQATRSFDVVLLDTAPLLTTNDAIDLMPSVDAVVLVVRPSVTTFEAAQRAREMLERVDADVVGAVLVGEDSVPRDAYYYYKSNRVGGGRRAKASKAAPDKTAAAIESDEPSTEPESELFPPEPAAEPALFPPESVTAHAESVPETS